MTRARILLESILLGVGLGCFAYSAVSSPRACFVFSLCFLFVNHVSNRIHQRKIGLLLSQMGELKAEYDADVARHRVESQERIHACFQLLMSKRAFDQKTEVA